MCGYIYSCGLSLVGHSLVTRVLLLHMYLEDGSHKAIIYMDSTQSHVIYAVIIL
jgi:hypothetical protein